MSITTDDMLPMLRGGLVAAVVGVLAATALKVAPAEAGVAAAPQQICVSDDQLAQAEASGWPMLSLVRS